MTLKRQGQKERQVGKGIAEFGYAPVYEVYHEDQLADDGRDIQALGGGYQISAVQKMNDKITFSRWRALPRLTQYSLTPDEAFRSSPIRKPKLTPDRDPDQAQYANPNSNPDSATHPAIHPPQKPKA